MEQMSGPAPQITDNPDLLKQALRKASRLARREFVASLNPAIRKALEQALAQQIRPHLHHGGCLASYAATGSEISPAACEDMARTLGLQIAFPRVVGDKLEFHLSARTDLQPGHRGIAEPDVNCPMVQPDVILVPLLAADSLGQRLGQGGGFYDRTLATLRRQKPVLAIGVCWDAQLVDAVPTEVFDQPLDAIATPTAFRHTPCAVKQGA